MLLNNIIYTGDTSESDDQDNSEGVEKKKTCEYNYDESSSSNTSGGDASKADSSFGSDSNDDDSVGLSGSNDEKAAAKKSGKRKRYTTHLVAAKFGTSKVHEALKSKRKVHVVTPEWLINCNFKWEKCVEQLFALTKDYE